MTFDYIRDRYYKNPWEADEEDFLVASRREQDRREAEAAYFLALSALMNAVKGMEDAGCRPPSGYDWCHVKESCEDWRDFE